MRRLFLRVCLAVVGVIALGMVAPAALEAQCTDCPRCGIQNKHDAPLGGSDFEGIHENICISPATCTGHPLCGPDLPSEMARREAFDGLLRNLTAGSEVAVFAMLSEFPEEATVNLGRRALQVYARPGCNEAAGSERTLIAHFSLSDAQIAAVNEWQVGRLVAALSPID